MLVLIFFINKFNFSVFSIIQDPSTQRLHWTASPNNILIIRKPGPQTLPEFRQLILKLLKVIQTSRFSFPNESNRVARF
jgi:hypothetical protein